MTATARKNFDVFVSYTSADSPLAEKFGETFRLQGLEPFLYRDIAPGENFSDVLWDALAECKALVAILPSSGPPASMAVEIGGAQAWGKPIYAVVSDPATVRLPTAPAHVHLLTSDAIDDLAREISLATDVLTDEDRGVLKELYREAELSVDQLALEDGARRRLTESFAERTGKYLAAEKLMSELIRMRKAAKLPRLPAMPKLRVRRRPA